MDATALAVLVLLGAAAGALGVWVLLFRASYAAESLTHGMLPGLVAASLLDLPLALGAVVSGGVAAGLAALAGRDARLGSDTGIAIVTTALFGLGGLLASGDPHALEPLLFGDLDRLGTGDVAVAAALAAACGLALAVAGRPLGRALLARSGAPFAVLALLAAVVTVVAQTVGALLALTLVLGPAAAALVISGRLPRALLLAPAAAAVAVLAGGAIAEAAGIEAAPAVAAAAVIIAPAAWAITTTITTTRRPATPTAAG